jgi:hypothetical protein
MNFFQVVPSSHNPIHGALRSRRIEFLEDLKLQNRDTANLELSDFTMNLRAADTAPPSRPARRYRCGVNGVKYQVDKAE